MAQCSECHAIISLRAPHLAAHKPGCSQTPDLAGGVERRQPVAKRDAIPARAGTPLGLHKIPIASEVGKRSVHGYVDPLARVYQTGGEASNFIYRKTRHVTMDNSVWKRILSDHLDSIDWLEFVDHQTNTCYRIRIEDACQYGRPVDRGIGERWCMPLSKFQHLDADGRPV